MIGLGLGPHNYLSGDCQNSEPTPTEMGSSSSYLIKNQRYHPNPQVQVPVYKYKCTSLFKNKHTTLSNTSKYNATAVHIPNV